MVRSLLTIGSALLPAEGRARWREESLALLLEVHGARRWRYAADLLLKLPLLAWQLHRGSAGGWPSPAAVLAGAGLLFAPVLVTCAMVLPAALGEDNAEALLVLAPTALGPYLVREAVRSARRPAGAAAYIVVGACGPVLGLGVLAAGTAAPAWLRPAATVVGYAAITAPAAFIAARSWRAARRGDGPRVLHQLGVVAGGCFTVEIAGLLAAMLGGGSPAPAPIAALLVLCLFAFVVTFVVWCVWMGMRLLILPRGRTTPRRAG